MTSRLTIQVCIIFAHDEAKFHHFRNHLGLLKPIPLTSVLFVIGTEGEHACPVMRYTGTGCPILGTFATAVVIIELKTTSNLYVIIAEASML